MAWTEQNQPQFQSEDSNIQIVHQSAPQPFTLLQQLPAAMASPSVRPGHIREDLVELMMMQNAQMHQVIMNNMTMSALSTFGYTQMPEHAGTHVTENDPDVYHHYHPYGPGLSHPVWMPPLTESHIPQLYTIQSFQEPHYPSHPVYTQHRRAVPPPPPPSATGTVGADVPPAAEYYEAERRQNGTEEIQN